jgi:hypothetical protein
MRVLSFVPLYLLSVLLFVVLFLLGIVVGTRFTLSLMMQILGYPTGIAAVLPKLVALVGGVGGSFWGLFLAAAATRFFGRHWEMPLDFGRHPVINTTISAFLTFILLLLIALVVLGDRLPVGAVLKFLLQT